MATIIDRHHFTYQVIFNNMNSDFISIARDDVFSSPMDELRKLHRYWNDLVKTATRWKEIAEKELVSYTEKKRIRRILREKLISECNRLIARISKLPVDNEQFFMKQTFLLEELEDRSIYIKKTF